jgi:hypothetical protein
MLGEAFDDGRYRQVSFEATSADCKVQIIRKENNVADGEEAAT